MLPARDEFSSHEEFERYSGPLNWNRQQGIYIYRADRLVQWGGWNGIRGIDEHTKLARAALDFDTDLDSVFNINVAKMRVTLPPQIRQMLERPINELCSYADDRYRKASRRGAWCATVYQSRQFDNEQPSGGRPNAPTPGTGDAGLGAAGGRDEGWRIRGLPPHRCRAGCSRLPEIASALGLDK